MLKSVIDFLKLPCARAVTAGLVVDLGFSIICGALLGTVFTAILSAQGVQAGEMESALSAMLAQTSWSLAVVLGGLLCSLAGSYVAGRIAVGEERKVGMMIVAIEVVSAFATADFSDFTRAFLVAQFGLVIAVMAGARMAADHNRCCKAAESR